MSCNIEAKGFFKIAICGTVSNEAPHQTMDKFYQNRPWKDILSLDKNCFNDIFWVLIPKIVLILA